MAKLDSWSEDVVPPWQGADGSHGPAYVFSLPCVCIGHLCPCSCLWCSWNKLGSVGVTQKLTGLGIWSGHLQTSEDLAPVRVSEIRCD